MHLESVPDNQTPAMKPTLSILRHSCIAILFFISSILDLSAQTTLSQGDLSIIGWNSGINRGLSFVTWVNISAGTEIRFTDNGFNSSSASTAANNIRWLETVLIWTANAALPAGSIVTIENETTNTGTANAISSNGVDGGLVAIGLSNYSGDQIFAYQGANMATTTTGVTGSAQTFNNTILFGLAYQANSLYNTWISSGSIGSSTSYLPSDLVAPNSIFLGNYATGGEYSGPRTGYSTPAAFRQLIADPLNWTIFTTPSLSITYTTTSFTLAPPPSITTHPSASTVCESQSTSFSIAANNATTYQWQVNSGSGYTNILNGGIYSGATTSTLSLSGVTTSLSGYTYRCVATGAASPAATSNGATLTVNTAGTWLGTSNSSWSNSANWRCGLVPGSGTDVTISASAPNMPVVNITTAACRNLTIASGASLTINSGQVLGIYGTVSNSGSFTAIGKTVFSGASQTIPGGSYTTLEIAGSGTKTAGGAVSVSGSLILTASMLQLGSNNLTIGSAGSISGGSSSSYIITNGTGALVQQGLGAGVRSAAISFPIGTAVGFNPLQLTNAGTADAFAARVIEHVYSSYDLSDVPTGVAQTGNNVRKTWFVTETVPGGSNVSMTFQWNGSDELPGFDRSQAYPAHYTGGRWSRRPNTLISGTGPYTMPITGINSFSPFGVGSLNSVMPLNLLSFTGKKDGNEVLLEWTTTKEVNTLAFDIEQSLGNGPATLVGSVPAGTGGKYSFRDKILTNNGSCVYRLKMRDIDGRFTFSPAVIVKLNQQPQQSFTVYPIPSTGPELMVTIPSSVRGIIEIIVTDIQGKRVVSRTLNADNNRLGKIPVASLRSGTYLLVVTDKSGARLSAQTFTRQ